MDNHLQHSQKLRLRKNKMLYGHTVLSTTLFARHRETFASRRLDSRQVQRLEKNSPRSEFVRLRLRPACNPLLILVSVPHNPS
jgi:hypothetical protein